MMLEVELEYEDDQFEIPDVFEVIKEVTEDISYNNYELSKVSS